MGLTSCRLTTLTVGKRINITHLKQDKVKHYHARHGIKTKGKTKNEETEHLFIVHDDDSDITLAGIM